MEVFILSAVRSPIGKFLGGLSDVPAPKLASALIPAALERAKVTAAQIDEAIFGNVIQAGLGQNPSRQAVLGAGFPTSIPAYTVNKVCGSGLKAAMLGAQAIRAGDAELVLVGGFESMSRAPHLLEGARTGLKYGDGKLVDSLIRDGLWCPFENWPMGDAAEYIAGKCQVSRAEQDQFAAVSHQRAVQAWEAGAFQAEVVPITVGTGAKAKTISRDEGIRADTTVDILAKLRPAFSEQGTVTAGNSSQLSDGAVAVVLASEAAAKKSGVKPLARVVAYATSGVDPKDIFIAPVPAIRQVLEKANLSLKDIDLFELNEAFASQMLACSKELKLGESRVNVNGGAIALGHPIGASGARVLTTLVHALQQRGLKRGLASLCLGGGNAVAMVVETL